MLTCLVETPYEVRYDDWVKQTHHYGYIDYCRYSDKEKEIVDVIFNGPATIVFWGDGTKTVVKCSEEEFDHEKGLAMAIAKKFLGTGETQGNYYNTFKKWIPEERATSTMYIDGDTFGSITKVISNAVDNAVKSLNKMKGE